MKKIFSTLGRIIIPLLLILASQTVNAQTRISDVASYMRNYGLWTSSETRTANLVEDQQTTWWYRTFVYGILKVIFSFNRKSIYGATGDGKGDGSPNIQVNG